jgi:CubicO group peptidase (beta-lactamase class C family)
MLASVTKTFTGTALLQAWEEGKIGLDDPINTLLPFEVNNPYTESEVITVRHLATHTSGLLDNWPVYGSLYVPGDSPIALGDFLQGYLVEGGEWYDAESNFADRMPGEEYEYSNVGAALSGYLVEATTGTPLDDYAEAHIFAPLGMTNTHWHLADYEDTSVIAVPYDADGTPLDHYGYPTWPDGQLRSSANDLGRFLAALLNGGELEGARVLSEATVAMMLTPQIPEASTTQGWFWITDTSQGYLVAQHGGGDLGVSTLIAFSPDLNIGLVILTNTDDMITSPLGDALTSVIFNSSENLIR